MKKLFLLTKTLLAVALLCVGQSAWGQTAGTYYIQNVGTGKWLSPANSWETQASVLNHADYWKLAKVSDGIYTLESVVSNDGNTKIYLKGGYCDGTTQNLTFTAIGGKTNTYSIMEGTKYYTTDGTTVSATADDASSENAQWKLYSLSDLTTLMASATPASGVDATFFIKDHNLSRNNRDYSAWSNTGATAPKTSDSKESGTSRFSIEAFKKTFDVHQSLTSIPNGVYGLQVNGFYRQDGTDKLPYLYAGDNKVTLPARTGTENDMQAAAVSFVAGNYLSNRAAALVTDGNLTVGVGTEGTSCWTIFKNFHLTYYGNPTVANPLDMTSWIVNPDIEVDGEGTGETFQRNITGWSHNNTDDNYRPLALPNGDIDNTSGAFTNSYCFELYKGGGLSGKKVYQTITGLPNGVYKVQLAAFVNGDATDEFIYAVSDGQTFTKTLDGEASHSKLYELYAIVNNGTLEIGLDMNTSSRTWACIDNAHLYYYGVSNEAYALVQPNTICEIPASYPLNANDAANPFDAGSYATSTGGVTALRVNNTTATSWFDTDLATEGNQPYELADGEKVNINFKAYHGWHSTACSSSVAVYLPSGKELISYTYDINATKVTNVRIDGKTVDGFAAFSGQANCDVKNDKNANGFTATNQYYQNKAGYNPEVTMSVDGAGNVVFRFVITARSIDETFYGTIDTGGESIKLEKIVITDNSTDADRSIGISDLTITSETPTIPSIPTSKYTFDSETTPFVGGTVVDGTVVGKILRVNAETATATFGGKSGKGWNYVPAAKETVTIEFDAFNGYLGYSKTSTFSVLNSRGEVLVGYTYDTNSGNITDVKLGNATVEGFVAFNGRSRYGTNKSDEPINANKYNGSNNSSDKPYQTTAGYNPHVTMKVSGDGKVSLQFVCSGYSIDQSYEKTLEDVTIDLASLKIVDVGYSSNSDRATCYDNLLITTETIPDNVSGTITPAGWSTFASPYPLDLSTISGGTAYYASAASKGIVTLSTTTAKVPAGEGIMVKGTPGETFTIPVTADATTAISGNLLKGQTTTGTVAASTDGTYHYVFGYSKTNATDYGFYNLASNTEVAAGKAYLEVSGAITSLARALRFSFGDITGVDNVEATSEAKAQDGKYLENGKIVIVKNGVKYNAAGQQVK